MDVISGPLLITGDVWAHLVDSEATLETEVEAEAEVPWWRLRECRASSQNIIHVRVLYTYHCFILFTYIWFKFR